MNIAYLMQNGAPDLSTPSGPQLHTATVIKGLINLGHQVRTVAIQKKMLLYSDDLESWRIAQSGITQTKGFRLLESILRRMQSNFQLPYFDLFNSLHFADACTQLLKDCDILYERHGYSGYGGVITARLLGVPLVLEINGNILNEIDEIGVEMSSTQRSLGRWITHRTWLAATHIIAVSETLKKNLTSKVGIPAGRISVVLNGVNVDLFSQFFDEQQIRGLYNIGPGPVIVFVGSFQPWHGIELLVSSFSLVRSSFPDAQLIIVGDGESRNNIASLISKMNLGQCVMMTGRLPQEQVAAVISIAEIAVAPYPYEHSDIVGTPLKLLEYMAAGKAIVATTAPIHEIITDGVTGLRIAPASRVALAHGMTSLLGNKVLRNSLGDNARLEAHQHHSWDQAVGRINEIITTVQN